MLSIITISLIEFLFIFPNVIIAGSLLGFCTALTAFLLGDTSIKDNGYLTLNPTRFLNIKNVALFIGIMCLASNIFREGTMSSIIFLALIMSGINTFKELPINSRNFNDPILYEVLALLAGPLGAITYSFLLLLCLQALPLNPTTSSLVETLQNILWAFMNVGSTIGISLSVFLLIPLLPQTGGHITLLLIPDEYEEAKDFYITYGSMLLLILLLLPGVHENFSEILSSITKGIKIMLQALAAKII